MTTPRNPSARCDAVLALIDACLADAGAGFAGLDGSPRNPGHPPRVRRHLTLLPS